MKNTIVMYQTKSGAIELTVDAKHETFLLTQQQVAQLFDVQKAAISKHASNIFNSHELKKSATVSILETVQKEGKRKIVRAVEYYNLDLVLSIGYKVNSVKATKFRQWATKTLHAHIVDGYTINRSRIAKNYSVFLKAVEQVKALLPSSGTVDAQNTLELVKLFADTWFSLEAYDTSSLPQTGATKKQVMITAEDLKTALHELKQELLSKKEATDLFGAERQSDSVMSIVGNVFQSFGGDDLYPTIEEKAAHLLYFVIKNHPFADGNKRSGAFSFIWFLKKAGLLDVTRLTPTALTALTLLIAESDPKDKDQMTGLVIMLLRK